MSRAARHPATCPFPNTIPEIQFGIGGLVTILCGAMWHGHPWDVKTDPYSRAHEKGTGGSIHLVLG